VASNILAGIPPIDLLAEERELTFNQRRVKKRKLTAEEKGENRDNTLKVWNGQIRQADNELWTRTIIPNIEHWVRLG
jgi:hypothetical protein